ALSFFNYGNFLLRQNKHIEAAKNYEKAIELEESFVDAYYNIAWILTEVKAYKKALLYAKKGLDFDPDHDALQNILLKIRDNLG
ncbi:MAG: tetratricopeptide repeat protein, partial [Balneolaceae bacterium]|nr:tetratricopeptide repeat protein [Balneolaceae bacterium]